MKIDWLIYLPSAAICFVAAILLVRINPKRKRLVAIVSGVLLVCTIFASLVVYRYQKIIRPIRNSEVLVGAEMSFSALLKKPEMSDFRTDESTELYRAVTNYLENAFYLPCINQDGFSVGSRDVMLQYGTNEKVNLWMAFYEDTGPCILNGTKVYVFPKGSRGRKAYQDIEEILLKYK